MLKGQLHAHTTFSDGEMSPREAADEYSRLGFDFLAVTDHDHLIRPGYREAIESVRSNILIFTGMELTRSTRWGYVHVTRIEGDTEILHVFDHPAEYGFTLRQTLECIEDLSGELRVDAVEITHRGFYTNLYDTVAIPLPKVATDDSHAGHACGRAWIEVDTTLDRDAIIRAVRRGDARTRYAAGGIPRSGILIS